MYLDKPLLLWPGYKNRKALRDFLKTGAVIICNDVHKMGSALLCAAAIPLRKLIFVNPLLGIDPGAAGLFVDALRSVPLPFPPGETQIFMYSLSKHLRRGKAALFIPKENLGVITRGVAHSSATRFILPWTPRFPYFPGDCGPPAFGASCPVQEKSCLTMICGEPVQPNHLLLKDDSVGDLQRRSEAAIHALM